MSRTKRGRTVKGNVEVFGLPLVIIIAVFDESVARPRRKRPEATVVAGRRVVVVASREATEQLRRRASR